jgi:hypothetical protein
MKINKQIINNRIFQSFFSNNFSKLSSNSPNKQTAKFFSLKTLGLDSVPEIEKAFHSLEGKFNFLDDLDMEERSVPKIKESVFISPSPKDVQVIKSEKKFIPFTFTPGRYEIIVLNLLNSGSGVLECTFKGGSKKF